MFRRVLATTAILAFASLPVASETIELGDLSITGAYSFETPPTAKAAGGYLVVENSGSTDDTLIAVAAETGPVMLHLSEVDANGVASMVHQEDGIPVPAGGSVTLAPGGLHIMFMGLSAPFEAGNTVDVTLTFEAAGEVIVPMGIVERGAGHGAGHDTHEGDHGDHSGHGDAHKTN